MSKPKAFTFGDSIGPLGFPMHSAISRVVESAMKSQPAELRSHFRTSVSGTDGKSQVVDGYCRRMVNIKGNDFVDAEHADVSIVTSESIDRDNEVVMSSGLDWKQFNSNPVVPFAHDYTTFPVGRCLWVAQTQLSNGTAAWKAKTRYTPRPPADLHPAEAPWLPDTVWHFVRVGDLRGKSIGFIPMSMRNPTAVELERNPALADTWGMIDSAIILEYSPCAVPANGTALVESVAKAKSAGFDVAPDFCRVLSIVVPDGVPPIKKDGDAATIVTDNPNLDTTTNEEISLGDHVSWLSSQGTSRGRVEKMERDGHMAVPHSPDTVHGTPDDPACLCRAMKETAAGWSLTDHHIGHKRSKLTKIATLNIAKAEGGSENNNPAGGYAVQSEDNVTCPDCGKDMDGDEDMACYKCQGCGKKWAMDDAGGMKPYMEPAAAPKSIVSANTIKRAIERRHVNALKLAMNEATKSIKLEINPAPRVHCPAEVVKAAIERRRIAMRKTVMEHVGHMMADEKKRLMGRS